MPAVPRRPQGSVRPPSPTSGVPTGQTAQEALTQPLPGEDDPEVARRLVILRPRFAALGPNEPLRPSLTQIVPWDQIPKSPPISAEERKWLDPPSISRIKRTATTERESDQEYYARVRKAHAEWRTQADAFWARQRETQPWHCIDCGNPVPWGTHRCLYCLAAFKIASIEHFNPHLATRAEPDADVEPVDNVPADEDDPLLDFDPEEALAS